MWRNLREAWSTLLGSNHEVDDSIAEVLKDRLTSPFYGYFGLSWLIVNWYYIYIALFVSEDKIYERTKLLRHEFLLGTLPESYHSILSFIILPFLLTVIIFWVMPFVTNIFYVKHIKNKVVQETLRIRETAAKKEAQATADVQVIKAEIEKAKIEKEAASVSPEVIWKRDYEAFQSTRYFQKFYQIRESIYDYDGKVEIQNPMGGHLFKIDNDLVIYADSNDLINKSKGSISLTPKGKYFMKLYTGNYS